MANKKYSPDQLANITLQPTPPVGFTLIYPKSDGIYYLNDAGVETKLEAANLAVGGSGTVNRIPTWSATTTLADGTWAFNGNDIYPIVDGSNIGITGTNRIGTIYMASNIDYANNLNFNSSGTHVTFTTAGNVGIGTSAPQFKLEVVAGAGDTHKGMIVRDGANGQAVVIGISMGTTVGDASFGYNHYYDGTNLKFNGGSGNAAAGISFSGNGNGDTNFWHGGIGNADAIITPVIQATLTRTGNFGIGTSAPTAKLDVWDGKLNLSTTGFAHGITTIAPTTSFGQIEKNNSNGGFSISGFSTGMNTALSFVGFIGTGSASTAAIVLAAGKANGTGYQPLSSSDAALQIRNSGSDLITVLGSGNVGIGTIAPGSPLTILRNGTDLAIVDIESEVTWTVSGAVGVDIEINVTPTVDLGNYYAHVNAFRNKGTVSQSSSAAGGGINTFLNTYNLNTAGTLLNLTGLIFDNENTSTGTVTNFIGARFWHTANTGGGTVTNVIGFLVDDQTVGSISNIGYKSDISAGAGKYNFYASGTANNYFAGSVGVGTSTPGASALVDLTSTTKGMLAPRMTTTQRNAIVSPAESLLVFDTTLSQFYTYIGSWIPLVVPGVSKYATTITAPVAMATNTITHNLGTTDITVQLWLVTTGDLTSARVTNRLTNSVDVIFSSAPGEDVRVVVIG